MRLNTHRIHWSAVVAAGLTAILLAAAPSNAQNAVDRRNFAGLDIFGRGVLYSANYERYIKRVGFGAGFASWSLSPETVAIIPVYVSFRPVGTTNSLYLSGGVTVGTKFSTLFDSPHAVLGTASVGYEHVSGSGLVIRPTVNVLFDGHYALPWPGVMIGYRF